jgi:hypothetical protein
MIIGNRLYKINDKFELDRIDVSKRLVLGRDCSHNTLFLLFAVSDIKI